MMRANVEIIFDNQQKCESHVSDHDSAVVVRFPNLPLPPPNLGEEESSQIDLRRADGSPHHTLANRRCIHRITAWVLERCRFAAGCSVNVLPRPRLLCSRISPPGSARANSRLIRKASPVPPYLRLVVPSACWNASKMMRCFSGAIPIPVSVTENAITLFALFNTGCVPLQPVVTRLRRSRTRPCSVNFKAFDRRFLSTCCSRLASVRMASSK